MTPLILASEASESLKLGLHVEPWQWAAFVALIVTLLLGDLFIFHREAHEISVRSAAKESAVWIALGLAFTLVIWGWHGGAAAGQYLAGYLIEESLSIDNVFVWAVILTFFKVPSAYRFRVLFWGIFGALVLRAIFIFAGVALVETFEWVLYFFGGFLIYTAFKIAKHDEAEVHPEDNLALKLVQKIIPSTPDYDGQKMFTRINGKRLATPLFAVLIMVESTDVVFAVDSIPAIFAITADPFLVFASNAFAILGLRSLYFVLAGALTAFRYLKVSLAVVLAMVGTKMLAHHWLQEWLGEHFNLYMLAAIVLILGTGIGASLLTAPAARNAAS
jgi:tellurite resistance protein TerC